MKRIGWPPRVWLRIVCSTVLFAGLAWVAERSPALTKPFQPLAEVLTAMVATVLNWLGIGTRRELSTLTHSSGFGYQIDFACTGIIPAGLLTVAILSSLTSLRSRLWGVGIGVPCVLLLNLLRLVALFCIGVGHPSIFTWAHTVVGEGLMVAFLVGFFVARMRRAVESKVSHCSQRLPLEPASSGS